MIVIEQDSEEYVQVALNKLDVILDTVFNHPWKKSFGNVDHIVACDLGSIPLSSNSGIHDPVSDRRW